MRPRLDRQNPAKRRVNPSGSGLFISGRGLVGISVGEAGNPERQPRVVLLDHCATLISTGISTLSSYATLTVNPRPLLGAIWSGDALLISWPVATSNFVLEVSPSLFPANWVPVTNPPIQVGDEYQASIQPTNSSSFYRLRFLGP